MPCAADRTVTWQPRDLTGRRRGCDTRSRRMTIAARVTQPRAQQELA